jgi:hypothetical protein
MPNRGRVVNVGAGPPDEGCERDTCPRCGRERWELIVVPGCFYCDRCKVASPGPNERPPEPPRGEQMEHSSTAYPGQPIKGKELHRIGEALGLIGERGSEERCGGKPGKPHTVRIAHDPCVCPGCPDCQPEQGGAG